MKELFSSLSATVFYNLVSLVLPCLTATSAWFVFCAQRPPLRELVHKNHTETAFVLMLIAIFVGTVIDDLVMRIESRWLDAGRERRTGGLHGEEWWAYLRKPFAAEPSGRRQLRRLVARLKFELGVPVGVVVTAPALWLNSALSRPWATLTTALTVCLSAYLLVEAAATHDVLGPPRPDPHRHTSAHHHLHRTARPLVCAGRGFVPEICKIETYAQFPDAVVSISSTAPTIGAGLNSEKGARK